MIESRLVLYVNEVAKELIKEITAHEGTVFEIIEGFKNDTITYFPDLIYNDDIIKFYNEYKNDIKAILKDNNIRGGASEREQILNAIKIIMCVYLDDEIKDMLKAEGQHCE